MSNEEDATTSSSTAVIVNEASVSLIGDQQHTNNCHHSLSFAYQTVLRQDVDELSHWDDVCRAYRQYAAFAVKQFGLNHPNRLARLPASQQALLPTYLQYGSLDFSNRVKQFKEAAIRNQFCLDCILRHAGQLHSQQQAGGDGKFATEAQLSKVSSVLKSLARDWSAEGKAERDMAYLPIIESVKAYLPVPNNKQRSVPKICVPGAGVGRLACELAAAGYAVQGNEFSLYMLLASDFILNGPVVAAADAAAFEGGKQPLSISPWLLETRNVHAAIDPLRAVQIPDVDPFDMVASKRPDDDCEDETKGKEATVPINSQEPSPEVATPSAAPSVADFSMAAGDFCSIYSVDSEASAWDCVAACFFFDASPSIIEYLKVAHHMLKPGAFLISFGPLHWHWSGPAMLLSDASFPEYNERYSHLDPKYLQSYDFSWEDIQQILINIGFELLESKSDIPALYTADYRSMLRSEYRCVHFVARKKDTAPPLHLSAVNAEPDDPEQLAETTDAKSPG